LTGVVFYSFFIEESISFSSRDEETFYPVLRIRVIFFHEKILLEDIYRIFMFLLFFYFSLSFLPRDRFASLLSFFSFKYISWTNIFLLLTESKISD